MKPVTALILAAALAGPALASGGSAARALIDEYMISTERVSRVDADLYEVAYRSDLLVTRGCWVNAFGETAVVTYTRIIFIDANQVCTIVETRARDN